MRDDLSAALVFAMDVLGVVALGIALAWALLVRRRRGGELEPAAEALRPEPDALRSGRALHWQDLANLVLGVWLFASPWILNFGLYGHDLWIGANAWIVGTLVAVMALAALLRDALLLQRIYGFSDKPSAAWDHWVAGFLVIVFAAWTC